VEPQAIDDRRQFSTVRQTTSEYQLSPNSEIKGHYFEPNQLASTSLGKDVDRSIRKAMRPAVDQPRASPTWCGSTAATKNHAPAIPRGRHC
jgi:hypothetical protein